MGFAWLVCIMISIQSVVGSTIVVSAPKAPRAPTQRRVVRDDETDAEKLSADIEALMTESQGKWDKRPTHEMRKLGQPVLDTKPLKIAVNIPAAPGKGGDQILRKVKMAAGAAEEIKHAFFDAVEDRFLDFFDQRSVELTWEIFESSLVQGCQRTSAPLTDKQEEARSRTKRGDGCQKTLHLPTTREVNRIRNLVDSKLGTDMMNFVDVASKPGPKIHTLVYTFSIALQTSDTFDDPVKFSIDNVEITVSMK